MSSDVSNSSADSPFRDLAEREVIELAKTNPDAMSFLYRIHYPAIYGYVHRRVANSHDANDVVAEVFISMVRSLAKYRWTGTPFRCWLLTMATNQINRRIRRSKRTWFWQSLDESTASTNQEPCKATEERSDAVKLALQKLPVDLQSVIALYYFEDLSVETISQVMNCRPGTVKSRLSRGRDLLRKHISFNEETMTSERRTVGILSAPVET